MRNVGVLTSSRADYGLLRGLLFELKNDQRFALSVIATGSHFSAEQGETIREIHSDGFDIAAQVPVAPKPTQTLQILSDLGASLPVFGSVFSALNLEILVVLGDRSEVFAACFAATIVGLPIAHLHGGELTEGAIDDAFRHGITKMAHLHFVADTKYRNRVIQLGEHPSRVHCVGPMALDALALSTPIPQEELVADLGIGFENPIALVAMHPETAHPEKVEHHVDSFFGAISEISGVSFVFTCANMDDQGDRWNSAIADFARARKNVWFFHSLGSERFLSLMRESAVVVGNSSSGVIEAPMLGVASVNIGTRQEGRIRRPGVVDVGFDSREIRQAIELAVSQSRYRLALSENRGGLSILPSKKIVTELSRFDVGREKTKKFFDLVTFEPPGGESPDPA